MFSFLRTVLVTTCLAAPVLAEDITVFAAASLGEALDDAARGWEAETGHAVTLVLAGSSTLARQIDAGAPADVFVSANVDWMDWLADNGLLVADSQKDVASNRLVLIAPEGVVQSVEMGGGAPEILDMLGDDGRLAIALPEAVPAGIYGKAALLSLGLWDDIKDRLAPTDNVRAALSLVALGEAPLGIVYATDAMADKAVVVAEAFPEASHPPIRYSGAVIAESAIPAHAGDFLDWLTSANGQTAFARHGFLPPRGAP